MKKKMLFLVVCLFSVTFLFAGGAKETSEGKSEKNGGEKTYIRFSHPAAAQSEKEWVAAFEEEAESDYNVDLDFLTIPGGELIQKITVMALSGDFIDLLAAQEVNEFAALKILTPLNDYLENDPDLSKDDFIQSILSAASIDGKIYALPSVGIGYGTMVNTDMLEETGMSLEDVNSYDSLVEAAKRMTKDGKYGYAFCGSMARVAWRDFYVLAAGNGLLFNELDKPESKKKFIDVMELYLKLKPYTIPNVESVGWPDIHKMVVDGNAGFISTGTYFTGYVSGFNPDAVAYTRPIPPPLGPSASEPYVLVGSFGYGILSGSENKEVAWDLLKLALNEEYSAKLAGSMHISALKNISKNAVTMEMEKYYEGHLDSRQNQLDRWKTMISDYGITMPTLPGQAEIERVYQEKFFKMYNGDITPEEMYEEFMPEYIAIQKQFTTE